MDRTNLVFLESYKHLDKLCRDIYMSDRGVSNYIDHMKAISSYECKRIPNWNADLNMLIHLRHIRNQLTHETGTLIYPMCSQNDINWLECFHRRLLNASDPLALHAKCFARRPQKSCAVPPYKEADFQNKPDHQKLSDWTIVILCLLLFAGVAIFTINIIMLHNS